MVGGGSGGGESSSSSTVHGINIATPASAAPVHAVCAAGPPPLPEEQCWTGPVPRPHPPAGWNKYCNYATLGIWGEGRALGWMRASCLCIWCSRPVGCCNIYSMHRLGVSSCLTGRLPRPDVFLRALGEPAGFRGVTLGRHGVCRLPAILDGRSGAFPRNSCFWQGIRMGYAKNTTFSQGRSSDRPRDSYFLQGIRMGYAKNPRFPRDGPGTVPGTPIFYTGTVVVHWESCPNQSLS